VHTPKAGRQAPLQPRLVQSRRHQAPRCLAPKCLPISMGNWDTRSLSSLTGRCRWSVDFAIWTAQLGLKVVLHMLQRIYALCSWLNAKLRADLPTLVTTTHSGIWCSCSWQPLVRSQRL